MSLPETQLPVRVYLEDTDAGGIVYHGTYVRYMERARSEWLRQLGLQQSQTFESNLSFVIHRLDLRFERPARLDQCLTVGCTPVALSAATLTFEQEVREADKGALCCHGTAIIACIDLGTLRPRRIPSGIHAVLSGLPRRR